MVTCTFWILSDNLPNWQIRVLMLSDSFASYQPVLLKYLPGHIPVQGQDKIDLGHKTKDEVLNVCHPAQWDRSGQV